MAPKGRKGRGQSSAVVDVLSTEDMSKDQLEEHIVRLREELDREREERSYFQLERDKIQAFWEVSRRRWEEVQAAVRSRRREKEEAEERHRVEIAVYKQKLLHVLAEQHNTVSGLKTDAVTSSLVDQNQNTECELRLRTDLHNLQGALSDKTLHNQSCLKELKLKHQVDLMELTNEYERRIREMEETQQEKLRAVMEEAQKERSQEVQEVQERMRRREEELKEQQHRELRGAEELYCALNANVSRDRANLQDELQVALQQQQQAEKKLCAAQKENKRLSESLRDAQLKLPELQTQLELHNRNKKAALKSAARLKLIQEELKDLKVEHELLLHAFTKVECERDVLLQRHLQDVEELQLHCRMKEMMLHNKVETLTNTLTHNQEQLSAALQACTHTTHTSLQGEH